MSMNVNDEILRLERKLEGMESAEAKDIELKTVSKRIALSLTDAKALWMLKQNPNNEILKQIHYEKLTNDYDFGYRNDWMSER